MTFYLMQLIKILLGEFILLFASVLIFRSLWTLLDQYVGYDYLTIFLTVGVALTVLGLYIVNFEVKCELQKKNE
jgi:multisubunit Na+/H+ antiporter MnhG subunit